MRERDRQTHRGLGWKKGGSTAPVFKRDRPSEKARECVHVCVEGYRGGVQVAWSWRRPGPLSPGSARLHLSSAGTSAAQGALVTQR